MREQLAEEKGRYCRVVYTKDGRVKLEPVKVPQHVKQERRERAERRALLRRIERNRERAQVLDVSLTLFLAVALAVSDHVQAGADQCAADKSGSGGR